MKAIITWFATETTEKVISVLFLLALAAMLCADIKSA